jgi:cytochrome b561
MANGIDSYTPIARWLHWVMAVVIVVALSLGFYLEDLPRGPEKTALIQYHKAIGTTILSLAMIRLWWRLKHQPPSLPATLPPWQLKSSKWVHNALYFLMLAQPISGWVMSSARGFPVTLAGILPLPPLAPKSEALSNAFAGLHGMFGWTLAILVAGHAGIALKHHFVDRDSILLRMWPGGKGLPSDSAD